MVGVVVGETIMTGMISLYCTFQNYWVFSLSEDEGLQPLFQYVSLTEGWGSCVALYTGSSGEFPSSQDYRTCMFPE